MIATLKYITHRCTERECCGDVLEVTGSTLVRKTFLYVDGKPKYRGTKQGALDYAKEHGLEVQDA